MTQTGEMTLDDFLGHKPTARGGGNFLRSWKRDNPPRVDVWLHTRALILALYQHPWPRIVGREDRDTGALSREVWGGSFNSWESEDTLQRQYIRDRQTGERRYPPQICPMSLMIEAVRALVEAGQLSWTAPVFEFVGDDPSKGRVLRAAGLYGGYRFDEMTREEKAELKSLGILPSNAWQQNMMARCNYVFCVADNDNLDNGVQIATETTGLGEAVKREIAKAMESLGHEAGNPMRNPYCIRWQHHPNETPQNKYSATRMERIKLTDEIAALIRDSDPPSTERLSARGNVATLRASMEQHYVGPAGLLDWDTIFAEAEAEAGEEPPAGDSLDGSEEIFACDECRQPMRGDEYVCKSCGKEYEQPEKVGKPAPAVRSRSQAGRRAAPPAQDNGGGFDPDPDDDIPF